MSDQVLQQNPTDIVDENFLNQVYEQAQAVEIVEPLRPSCSEDDRIRCALQYGPQAIDNRILVSISENINKMAVAINESESEKREARKNYVEFFKDLLIGLIIAAGILIFADTFLGISVRIEFLVSVIIAIIADVFAIVHTLVKYTTNVEHYKAYNNLIDSLLKSIRHENWDTKDGTSDS